MQMMYLKRTMNKKVKGKGIKETKNNNNKA